MKNSDSIALLQECNSGSKMAISSIRDVLGDIQEEKLERLLENYIHKHEEYGEELHALLSANQSPPEEPKASAKTMAKVVTGVKLFADHSFDDADYRIKFIIPRFSTKNSHIAY